MAPTLRNKNSTTLILTRPKELEMHFWYWMIGVPVVGLVVGEMIESINNLWNRYK